MVALAYSLALFVIWTVTGRALAALLVPRLGVLRSWLLAPALGLAVFLLAVMTLNQAGLPIRTFARGLTLALAAGSGFVLWRERVRWPGRTANVFSMITLGALVWAGWPALKLGFSWISYANDDMANYCLAAERFAAQGFFDVPTMAQLGGRDYPAYYFFMHVADMMRFGAEHAVAWGAGVAGLKATQVFMPVILALMLTQLWAAAALVLHQGRRRRQALLTAALLAASPLFLLGALYQLIAQVAGIALMLATLALLTRTWGRLARVDLIRHGTLTAVAAAALCIAYPEPTPFLALAYFLYLGVGVMRQRVSLAAAIGVLAYTMLGVVVLLRYNVISYVSTLTMQLGSATNEGNLLLSLFPYFLLPTGFSNLFGWMPIARDFAGPVVGLSIAGGMTLAAAVLAWAIRGSWRATPVALLMLVNAAVAVKFFRGGNDFPLYKLAMWMQPTLLAGVAALAVGWRRRWAGPVVAAVFFATTLPTAYYYTSSSLGAVSGGLTELRFGSIEGLAIPKPRVPDAEISATVENVVAAKFAAAELIGTQLTFASRDYFYPNTRIDFRAPPAHVRLHPHLEEMAQSRPRMVERNTRQVVTGELWHTEFSQPVLARPADHYLGMANRLSLFNKFGHTQNETMHGVFELRPADEVKNRLIFVHSGRGNHYYLGDRAFISFFQQEADTYNPGGDFCGLGRFLLLRVERPSEEIYIRIAATRTGLVGRTAWRDGSVVHGESDLPLGVVGNGAFNLFVGPLKPRRLNDAAYVALDFAEIAGSIRDRRVGMKAAYNRHVPLDYRRIIGWARDISALTPAEYATMSRPTRLGRFPEDLSRAQGLEFSGLYEDGWMSPDSRVTLGATPAGGVIRVRLMVPEVPGTALGTGQLELQVDGWKQVLPATTGTFDWLVPVPRATTATQIGLHLTATTRLPDGDERPTGAKLELLETLPQLPLRTFDFGVAGTTRPAATGVDQDGWMEPRATLSLPAGERPLRVKLRVEFPGWAGVPKGRLQVSVDGRAETLHPLPPGETVTSVMLAPSPAPRSLRLELADTFSLPAPDLRRRGARLLKVEVEETP
jgi:hypothetical protein